MNIIVPGKCILAGEHSVVRGRPALVAPLFSKTLRLTCHRAESWELKGPPALEKAILRAQEILGKKSAWQVSMTSEIPLQAGLGSSAALSVAITKLLSPDTENLFSLAMELENLFHGKSSGIDVAAVLSQTPIRFQTGKAEAQQLKSLQHFFLFDTGLRSSTKDCVKQVESLKRADLDDRMEKAVALMAQDSLLALQEAMEMASSCFREWNLIPPLVEEQMKALKARGALAVKPTGSGNGGFLLSLWEHPPLGLLPIVDFSNNP